MQRVDEDTYIDETLVTCVEYQLFIDEMREQGKYYQPDHWTSHQFLSGQAREPILGVRHSDALAFCDWLAKREREELSYRLPTQTEALDYPLEIPSQAPLGYWITGGSDQFEFAWSAPMPIDARVISLDPALQNALKRARKRIRDQDRAIDHERARIHYYNNHPRDINRSRLRPYELHRALLLDLKLKRVDELAQSLTREFDQALNHVRAHPLDLERTRAGLLSLGTEPTHGLARALTRSLDRAWPPNLKRTHAFGRSLGRAFVLGDTSDLNFNLLVDLFTLQERIVGHSPAFEGIRLVKERK